MRTLYVTACALLAVILLGCSVNSMSLQVDVGSVRASTRVAGITVQRASAQPPAGGRNRLTDQQVGATSQPTTQVAEQPSTAPSKRYRRRSYLELRRMRERRRMGGAGFAVFDQSIANMVSAPGAAALGPSLQPAGRAGGIGFVALGEVGLQRGGLLGFRANQNLFAPMANPAMPVCMQLSNAGLFSIGLIPNLDACHSRFAR